MKHTLALTAFTTLSLASCAFGQSLEAKVADLEARLAALEQPSANNRLEATWRPGLYLQTADKAVQLHLGGRIQNDWSFILDSDDALDDEVGAMKDTTDFRRIWLEMEGTLYDRTFFAIHLDFAGGKVGVRSLYLGLKEVPLLGTLRIGNQQEPFGLEELQSSAGLLFLERSLSLFYPSYNGGIRFIRPLADQRMSLSGGIFRDTDDSGKFVGNDGYNLTARLTGLPYVNEDSTKLVHLGIAGSRQDTPEGSTQFRGRPENRWTPFFVSATNVPADDVTLLGLEAALVLNSLSLQAEYVAANTESEGADHTFSGYYVEVAYLLTGEVRPYDRANGIFGKIKPKQNFGKDGWGAFELAARASAVDLNDNDVTGGKMDNYTLGLNWYLNPSVRVMLNYVHSELDSIGNADAVLARFQVAF